MSFSRLIISSLLTLALASAASLGPVQVSNPNAVKILPSPGSHWARSLQKSIRQQLLQQDKPALKVPPAQFFTQTLDHFNAYNQGTYQQRYYVNDTFFSNAYDAPVFIMIDGEGAATGQLAVWGHHIQLAEKFGALVFVVEHRYYGASVPVPNFSTENLQYLSSQQALADLAVFLEAQAQVYSLDIRTRNRVIAFGGSYSGALASWFRLKYPHIVYASVASSGPVLAKLDFFEYNSVVVGSLGTEIVGGSQECSKAVFKGFQQIDEIFARKGFKSQAVLEKSFQSCAPILSRLDQANFVSDVGGTFMGAVQYNGQTEPSIAPLCQAMLNESLGDYFERLAYITVAVSDSTDCIDYSFEGMLEQLANITVDYSAYVGERPWTYQTCVQFGYYQTCEPWNGACDFSAKMDLFSNTILCQKLFGLSTDTVESRIQFSNDYYGGNKPDITRVVYVNGLVDPWHALSVLESDPANDVTAIVIPGGSHCQNMDPASSSDSAFMKQAKIEIEAIVKRWVTIPPILNEESSAVV